MEAEKWSVTHGLQGKRQSTFFHFIKKQTNKQTWCPRCSSSYSSEIQKRWTCSQFSHFVWYQTNNLLTIMCKMLCVLSLRDLFDGADFLPVWVAWHSKAHLSFWKRKKPLLSVQAVLWTVCPVKTTLTAWGQSQFTHHCPGKLERFQRSQLYTGIRADIVTTFFVCLVFFFFFFFFQNSYP